MWSKGWIDARDLQPGDLLRSDDGRFVAVEEVFDTGVVEAVYNCSVAEYHTYFVGSDDWGFSVWAHNTCKVALGEKQLKKVIDELKKAIPGPARKYFTIAVAKVKDANGKIQWVVSISGPKGKIDAKYMRIIEQNLPKNARIQVAFNHHPRATTGPLGNRLDDAERHIERTLRRDGRELISLNATNNICDRCMAALGRFANWAS